MATKKAKAEIQDRAEWADPDGGRQRAIDDKGDIYELRNGKWVFTGLNEQQRVEVSPMESFGAMATRGLSAPLRMFQGAAGDEDAALMQRYYGQNPIAAGAGSLVGAAPLIAAGGVLGAGSGIAANVGIQGALGALSDAEDPLTGALLSAATVMGAGLLPQVSRALQGGGRRVAGAVRSGGGAVGGVGRTPASAADDAALAAGGALDDVAEVVARPGAAGPLPAQPAGTFTSRAGAAAPAGARGGAPQMMAAGADDAGTAANVGINATRAAMPADQLAEARRLGLYVDPASEYGSDLLAGLQQRRGLSDVMGVGARHNQNLLTGAAGRAAGIDGPVINRFTLDQAMERTKNGFEVLAGETQAVPKIHVERKLAALLDDPMAHAPLIRRLKQAPEMLDGRQLGSLQSFLAKERFKFNKGGDLNMAEAYDMAHNDILNVIERGLPKGSRGNFGRLRQEYHGQMVLDRPGVLGAGDTVNPTSFYMATRKAGRASDSLKVARRMAMHMHNMRETLGNSGTAGRSKELMGGLLGTGGAAFGGLVGGPVGAAIGGAAGGAAGMAGYGPGALFAAYNRSAPMLAGLMQRGQGGL